MISNSKLWVSAAVALIFSAPVGLAQQSSTDDLKKDMQELRDSVKAMQKDLQEIKALLLSRAPSTPPQNVVLDLGNNPIRGERTAKLTLIEFSDYQ